MSSPQCSCTFYCKICTRLLLYPFCCVSCGLATCTAFSSLCLLFFSFLREHSLYFSPYLKHSTTTSSCFLIILSYPTLHHPACQYLKFILRNNFPLFFLSSIPVVLCHNLAKWLSHYLIFLFPFFSFITKVEHGKILCDKSQKWSHHTESQVMSQHVTKKLADGHENCRRQDT